MKTSDFDFPLPESLIAKDPLPERDGSRLLVLGRDGSVRNRRFPDLAEHLEAGDMLVLNKTKVLPFRLRGVKRDGVELDILLVRNVGGNRWDIMSRGRYSGPLFVSSRLTAHIERGRTAELFYDGDLRDILWEWGEMPLPPYIKRRSTDMDKERYQTVYAEVEGSIAAPTAGLHFTGPLLDRLEKKGVLVRRLTLHVGRGTFVPLRAETVAEHRMEREHFQMDAELADEIRSIGGRLVAVGTTVARALEGFFSGRWAADGGANGSIRGSTDIFIHPGYEFRAVNSLLTNFHLPRSTPLLLASALCGRERLLAAYDHAIQRNYRFFSYGDAMLIQ